MSTLTPPPAIQIRLAESYRNLPDAQRAIADVLMADPLLGALWGIESMAERARVSVGTVIRFAKRLGYKGFSEFRDALREACSTRSEEAELQQLDIPRTCSGRSAASSAGMGSTFRGSSRPWIPPCWNPPPACCWTRTIG